MEWPRWKVRCPPCWIYWSLESFIPDFYVLWWGSVPPNRLAKWGSLHAFFWAFHLSLIYTFFARFHSVGIFFGSPALARFRAGRHCMQSEPFSLTALSLHVRGPLCCGWNYETPNSNPPYTVYKVCGVAFLSTDNPLSIFFWYLPRLLAKQWTWPAKLSTFGMC